MAKGPVTLSRFELRLQTIKKYRANSGFIVVTVVRFFSYLAANRQTAFRMLTTIVVTVLFSRIRTTSNCTQRGLIKLCI